MILKKKKNRRMRILEHRIFLSLLAGKFSAFEQMLLTEPIFLKKRRTRIVSTVFFFFSFWRENSKLLNSSWLKFFLQSNTKANQLSRFCKKNGSSLEWDALNLSGTTKYFIFLSNRRLACLIRHLSVCKIMK